MNLSQTKAKDFYFYQLTLNKHKQSLNTMNTNKYY